MARNIAVISSTGAISSVANTGQFPRNTAANYGVQIEPIAGITVTATQVTYTQNSDRRYHCNLHQVVAVNYTGGTTQAITMVSQNGHTTTGATATITVNAFNVPLTAAIVAGGTGTVATGDIVSIADPTGAGAQWTVTASGGVISALAYVANSATATAIDPRLVIGNVYITVGTTNVIESTAAMEMFRWFLNQNFMQNSTPSLGQFPIFFRENWRNLTGSRANTWDMAGQGIFSSKFNINPGYIGVNVTGVMIYDYIRNTSAGEIDQVTYQGYVNAGSAPAPSLRIISRQLLTMTMTGGNYIMPTGNIPTGWPILRMHFFPATPGTISQVFMKSDSDTRLQGFVGASQNGLTVDQVNEFLIENNFRRDMTNTAPSINPDFSFIADYDQRTANQLKVASVNMTITNSGGTQGLTVLLEQLKTSYS